MCGSGGGGGGGGGGDDCLSLELKYYKNLYQNYS